MTPIQKIAVSIGEIEGMQNALVKAGSKVGTEFDDQCRAAFSALEKARDEMTMVVLQHVKKGAA